MSELPFYTEDSVHALNCSKFDVVRPEALMIDNVKISNNLTFTDRVLPVTNRFLDENKEFPMSYFLDLHSKVKSFGTHNYKGARIPLSHNNINVENCRFYLTKF